MLAPAGSVPTQLATVAPLLTITSACAGGTARKAAAGTPRTAALDIQPRRDSLNARIVSLTRSPLLVCAPDLQAGNHMECPIT